MKICPACRHEIPNEAAFCGFCGFRLTPIPEEDHAALQQSMKPIEVDIPELMTAVREAEARDLEALKKKTIKQQAVQPAPPDEVPSSTLADTKPQRKVPARPKKSEEAPLVASTPAKESVAKESVPAPSPAAALEPLEIEKPQEVDHEDRQFRRFPIKVEVDYATEHNFFTGFTENLSSGGLFVATHIPAELGDVLSLTFTVPGLDENITAVGRVQWVREYNENSPDTIPGMGLRFLKLSKEARAAIEMFIQHRRPIFFD